MEEKKYISKNLSTCDIRAFGKQTNRHLGEMHFKNYLHIFEWLTTNDSLLILLVFYMQFGI